MTITRRTLNKGLLAATLHTAALLSSRSALAATNLISPSTEDPDPKYEFEVATIKPINPVGTRMQGVEIDANGVVRLGSLPLRTLITIAWNAAYWQLDAPPAEWMTKTLYDIVAKPPELPSPKTYSQRFSWFAIEDPRLRAMLQGLLMDRFQLKLRTEQRPSPVYVLERDDHAALKLIPLDDPQLESAKNTSPGQIGRNPGRGFAIYNMSMPALAKSLSDYVYHRPVLDQTGLAGIYNFESRTIVTQEEFDSPDQNSSFQSAIKEMGLKTRQTKGMSEFFIVDSASPPSPN